MDDDTAEKNTKERPKWDMDLDYASLDGNWLERNAAERQLGFAYCPMLLPDSYWAETKRTLRISWSLIITQVCTSAMQPISTMFGGQLGEIDLDVIGLANTLINILGTTIALGMCTACVTLFSQAYGNDNRKLLGTLLQRSLIIISLTLSLCYALHLNIEGILVILGQDREIARLTAEYLLLFTPGMFCMFVNAVLVTFLQCQNVVLPFAIIGVVTLAFLALFQYVCIFVLNWGLQGSAIAQAAAYCVNLLFTLAFIFITKIHKATWNGWSRGCLQEWGVIARLGVLGVLMASFEWWAFEVTVLLSGVLGKRQLASQSIIFNISSLVYAFVKGLSAGISIRVGQAVGSGHPEDAKVSAKVGLIMAGCTSLLFLVLMVLLRTELPRLFTNNSNVLDMTANLMPLSALYSAFACYASVSRAILRGCGKQSVGTIVAFVSYYIVALPIGVPLMLLTSFGMTGIWIGLNVGLFIGTVVYLVYILHTVDWENVARQGKERLCTFTELVVSVTSNERTPLLRASKTSNVDIRRPIQSNASLTRRVVVQRVSTVIACICVVSASVFLRHLVHFHFLPYERTMFRNVTAASWRNETTWQDITVLLWKVM